MNEEEFKAVQKERPLDIRRVVGMTSAALERYLVMREEEDAECDEADEPADETWPTMALEHFSSEKVKG